jgi:hypothetical protein
VDYLTGILTRPKAIDPFQMDFRVSRKKDAKARIWFEGIKSRGRITRPSVLPQYLVF